MTSLRGTGFAILLLCVICFGVRVPAHAVEPATEPSIRIEAKDGGYVVTTAAYQARIGADGNLHALTVNGVEFLDDRTAGSVGASYYVERPLALPTLRLRQREITATDGIYTIRYQFYEGFVTLSLKQTSPKGAAFIAVCDAHVAFVEDLTTNAVASCPVDYQWSDVKMTAPTGEYVMLKGGTRIWGRDIGRQIWERSNLAPNKEYSLSIIPGQGAPPAPDLEQLTGLSIALDEPGKLVNAGDQAVVRVTFENNSNRPITSEFTARVESSLGAVVLDERKPFTCAPHDVATASWTIAPGASDFYRAATSVSLDGSVKTAKATFGHNISTLAPTSQAQADFADYWERVVAEAKAADVKFTVLEDLQRSTGTVKVYEAAITADGVTFSGWLSVPKYQERYPALLLLPSDRGRTISPTPTLADRGFVVLCIDPTGQPIRATLSPFIDQIAVNPASPNTYGLRTMMVRCMRAVSALATLPEVDAQRIAVTGVGLGGGMAMILAAIDDRIQAVAPDVPFLGDIEYGSERPDWPYLEIAEFLDDHPEQREAVMKTLSYYDVAHFVDRITCPIFVSAGIEDQYSRPANIVRVYNRIPGPRLLNLYRAGHEGGGVRHWQEKMDWLVNILGLPSPAAPVKEKTETP